MSTLRAPRVWAAIVLLAAAVGVVSWQQNEPGLTAGTLSVSADEWKIAQLNEPDPRKATDYLATSPMWGIVEIVKPPSVEIKIEPRWRFMATMSAGKEKIVMIGIEKQPDQQLRVGDLLPGGAKILDIKEDQICILINGKKRSLSIFRQGAQTL